MQSTRCYDAFSPYIPAIIINAILLELWLFRGKKNPKGIFVLSINWNKIADAVYTQTFGTIICVYIYIYTFLIRAERLRNLRTLTPSLRG